MPIFSAILRPRRQRTSLIGLVQHLAVLDLDRLFSLAASHAYRGVSACALGGLANDRTSFISGRLPLHFRQACRRTIFRIALRGALLDAFAYCVIVFSLFLAFSASCFAPPRHCPGQLSFLFPSLSLSLGRHLRFPSWTLVACDPCRVQSESVVAVCLATQPALHAARGRSPDLKPVDPSTRLWLP